MESDEDRAQLRAVEIEIVSRTGAAIPGWVRTVVERLVGAWGRCSDAEVARLAEAAEIAGTEAAARITSELRELFAVPLDEQRSTPLQVVRSGFREPTAALAEAGIPEVVRDPFDERMHPGDRYDLAPRSLADLGDPDLGPLLLAWGMGKARLLRDSGRSRTSSD
ncbi:MAG: hypothetical protein ABJC79_15950 [Acidimicrobiia bacterium]